MMFSQHVLRPRNAACLYPLWDPSQRFQFPASFLPCCKTAFFAIHATGRPWRWRPTARTWRSKRWRKLPAHNIPWSEAAFPVGWVFTALGKTKEQFRLSMLLVVLFVIAMASGIRFGLLGVTYAYAGWTLISGWLNLRLIGKYIELPVQVVLTAVLPITLMAGAMGLVVDMIDTGPAHARPFIARLIAGFLAGVGTYAALCLAVRNETFEEMMKLTLGRFGVRNPLYRT